MDNTQTAEWKRGFRVTREALRPASNKQECFYCHRPVGEVHGEDCVLVRRLVRLRATIDYVKPVPAHWGPEQIRFRFQDSTWCADNIVEDLKEWIAAKDAADGTCMCPDTEVTYVGEFAGGETYLDESGGNLERNESAMDIIYRGLLRLRVELGEKYLPAVSAEELEQGIKDVIAGLLERAISKSENGEQDG